tara:strand:- start:247 stop:351 length:105 start_codon:yes stop_codon:yes gene_type:complete
MKLLSFSDFHCDKASAQMGVAASGEANGTVAQIG